MRVAFKNTGPEQAFNNMTESFITVVNRKIEFYGQGEYRFLGTGLRSQTFACMMDSYAREKKLNVACFGRDYYVLQGNEDDLKVFLHENRRQFILNMFGGLGEAEDYGGKMAKIIVSDQDSTMHLNA